jgi:hypothetical protein
MSIIFVHNEKKISPSEIVNYLRKYATSNSDNNSVAESTAEKFVKNLTVDELINSSIDYEFDKVDGSKVFNIARSGVEKLSKKNETIFNKMTESDGQIHTVFRWVKHDLFEIEIFQESDDPVVVDNGDELCVKIKADREMIKSLLFKIFSKYPKVELTDNDDRRFSYEELSSKVTCANLKFFFPKWE